MRWLIGGLLGLLVLLQYRLWFAEGGLAEANRLQVQLEEAEAENAELTARVAEAGGIDAVVGRDGIGWTEIARRMTSARRTHKQCEERYINHLDPNIKKGPWTNAEVRRRTLLAKTLPAKNLTRCASARRRCASSVPTSTWATNGRRLPSSCPGARTTR